MQINAIKRADAVEDATGRQRDEKPEERVDTSHLRLVSR